MEKTDPNIDNKKALIVVEKDESDLVVSNCNRNFDFRALYCCFRVKFGTIDNILPISVKFALISSLVHGFNERIFYSALFYESFSKDLRFLKTEKVLFSQHVLSCIGFIIWGLGYKYLDITLVLCTSFLIWGLASLFQTLDNSVFTILLCRCLVSFSQSSLEPLIQVLAEEMDSKKHMVKLFGVSSCLKAIGAFLAVSTVSIVYMNGTPSNFNASYNKIWVFSGVISIIVFLAYASLYISSSFKNGKYKPSNNYSSGDSCRGIESDFGDNHNNDQNEIHPELNTFLIENKHVYEFSGSSKVVLIVAFFIVYIVGTLVSIVKEMYGLVQINSSFYVENAYNTVKSTVIHGNEELSFNITYYTLRTIVFLLGSALGSFFFGVLYSKLYNIYKKVELPAYSGKSTFTFGVSNHKHLCFTLILSGIMLQVLIFVFLHSSNVSTKILKYVINNNNPKIFPFFIHLIEIFTIGLILTIIVDVIMRSEVVFISRGRSSVALYGCYLAVAGILSNSSFYKYIGLFTVDEKYLVKLSNGIKVNIFPTIFHNPMKLFFGDSINYIYKFNFPESFEKAQEIHIYTSIYNIALYISISIFISWIYVIFITLKTRKMSSGSNCDNKCSVGTGKSQS